MDFEQITTELTDGALTITLNRPDRLNAWTPTMGRELIAALEAAFEHDELAIVEAAASGTEVECSVLGGDSPRASQPGEIVLQSAFYDYSAKYEPGGMELIVPARVSAPVLAAVQSLALAVFELCGCADLARVDFFVDGERVLVNELNTMPGFTRTSVYGSRAARPRSNA